MRASIFILYIRRLPICIRGGVRNFFTYFEIVRNMKTIFLLLGPLYVCAMPMVMMMIGMLKTQNGHDWDNFKATTSRFCMVIDLSDIYKLMTTMMLMVIMII